MAGDFDEFLDAEEQRMQGNVRAPQQPGGEYDTALDAEATQRRDALAASLRQAVEVNPDKAARSRQLEGQTGIPQPVVERNEDVVANLARVRELMDLSRQSPVLAAQLANPDFAKLAHDDAENLSVLEQAMGYFSKGGRAVFASIPRTNAALWGLAQAGAEVTSKFITGPLAGLTGGHDSGAVAAEGFAEKRKRNEEHAKYIRRFEKDAGFTESSVYGGLESLGANLMLMPLAYASGNPNVALVPMAAATGGQEFGKVSDVGGKPLLEKLAYASHQALVEYVTEKLPMQKLIGDLKAGTGFGKMVLHQAATEIPGEQIATVLQDMNEWAVIDRNKGKTFNDYLAERPSAAAATLIAKLVYVGGQTTVASGVEMAANKLGGGLERAAEAERTVEFFKKLAESTKTSKLFARDPQTFGEFMQAAAEQDGNVTDVYVSGRELAAALEQSAVKIPELVQQQLPEAVATGGDVRIPIGEYTAHFAASDIGNTLLQHLKTAPEAMSQKESEEFYKEHGAQFKQQAEKILADQAGNAELQQGAQAVHGHFMEQLGAANRFTPEVNNAYASLLRDFYVATAQRLGITPQEMLARYPLRVAAENVAREVQMEQKDRFTSVDGKWVYFKPGAVVKQEQYPGVLAKILSVKENRNGPTRYTLEVNLTGHPEGVDENGARQDVKVIEASDEELNRLNPPQPEQSAAPDPLNQAIDKVGEQRFGEISQRHMLEARAKANAEGKPYGEIERQAAMQSAAQEILSHSLDQSSVDRLKEIAGLSRIEKHLKPEERAKLRKDTGARLLELLRDMPSAKEMAAVALAGSAKRGWYQHSAEAMVQVFGPDAPRFAALLAALSPQTSVESNLFNALSTWKNWVKAGRPQTRAAIVEIMGKSVEGNRGEASVLGAWIPNAVRALTAEDAGRLVLSGPKVNSFYSNLIGITDEVTNDSWMANYAAVDQVIFSGGLNVAGTDPGKSPGYLAMSVRTRQAAEALTKLTGETWTPAEVQETVWSWAKSVFELIDSPLSGGKTAVELLKEGAVTDELINSTPDFRSLFHNPKYQSILEKAGYGEQVKSLEAPQRADVGAGSQEPRAQGEAGAPAQPAGPSKHLLAAARRLDTLRRERREGIADAGKPARAKPARESFKTLEAFEEALGRWQENQGKIISSTRSKDSPLT